MKSSSQNSLHNLNANKALPSWHRVNTRFRYRSLMLWPGERDSTNPAIQKKFALNSAQK